MKKSFQDWKEEELRLAFGLKKVRNHPLLLEWIQKDAPISQKDYDDIDGLRVFASDRINFFNADELEFHFIAPFVKIVNLFGERFSTFTQRPIKEKVKDISGNEVNLYGIPEFFVAIGLQRPRQPFFFVKEYKPEQRGNNDPLGQLMAAMIAAQHKNKVEFPLKGCYVLGRNWFFIILTPDGVYSVSDAFVSTQDDIFQIFKVLKNTKTEIERLIERYDFK